MAADVKPVAGEPSGEDMLAKAAQRAAPRLLATTKGVRYRITGTFVSEILALVAAVEAMHATHIIESGTASGFSTERAGMVAANLAGRRAARAAAKGWRR